MRPPEKTTKGINKMKKSTLSLKGMVKGYNPEFRIDKEGQYVLLTGVAFDSRELQPLLPILRAGGQYELKAGPDGNLVIYTKDYTSEGEFPSE